MKKTSEMKCGLIGKPLGHSYSPLIHSCLADYEYKLIELDENEVGSFIKSDKYDALNVTIPYKKTVMPFLDVISPEAERIGSVNTVTHLPDGRLSAAPPAGHTRPGQKLRPGPQSHPAGRG